MKIILSPTRCETQLSVSVIGDTLIVNDVAFDFGPLAEGAILPTEAVASDWFTGPVTRLNGQIEVTLALPHGAVAPHQTLFPDPVVTTTNGPVALPPYEV